MFNSRQLPFPSPDDFEYDCTLESCLEKSASNAAVSFARECLRLNPKKRPSAKDLLAHDFFNDLRIWFDEDFK